MNAEFVLRIKRHIADDALGGERFKGGYVYWA